MSFAQLKKQRNSSLNRLTEELNKIQKPQGDNGNDDRFWRPELDKSGNGYAVIRFLPPSNGEDLPWVRIFNHGFQGPGGWYIENSLTTINQKDPVSELNTQLWNTGIEANKNLVRKQKRRLTYISNILVVEDSKHPENEGQIFLFKYGKRIFDKINDLMNPQFEDEEPINPFDFWDGANFKLKIRKVEGFTNYDKSEFESTSSLLDGDDKQLEALWNKQYSLADFLKPENFKSYDELKTRLDKALGVGVNKNISTNIEEDDTINVPTTSFNTGSSTMSVDDDDDDDDAMSYFAKLAQED